MVNFQTNPRRVKIKPTSSARSFDTQISKRLIDSLDVGHYPRQADGLAALTTRPAGEEFWRGPYLKGVVPLDAWNHPYLYKRPDRGTSGYSLQSLGADGKAGGEGEDADIAAPSSTP